jgi:uncharacterized cupredoxin-like copper-binding protein
MANRGLTSNIPIWVRVPGIIVLVLGAVVVGAMWLGGSGPDSHGRGDPMQGMDHDGPEPTQVVTVAMKDTAYEPTEITVERGALVRLEFENTGERLHDFTIDDIAIEDMRMDSSNALQPGSDRAVKLALEPGTSSAIQFSPTEAGEYEFYCGQPGHRDAGMLGVLRVDAPPEDGDHGSPGGDGDHGRSGHGDGH